MVFNNSPSVYSLNDAHLDCRYSDITSSELSTHFDNKYSLGRFNPVIFSTHSGFLLRFEVAGTAELPSWHAVPSWGIVGGCPPPTGGGFRGPPPENFRIFKAPGCILGHFWPIWLSVLAPLNKTFAA